MDNLSYEQLRLEFNRPSTKDKLRKELGTKCRICGTEENLEFHHIIVDDGI